MKTPVDFNALQVDIRKETKEAPSVSTLKRLWSYVASKSDRSMSTLNSLTRYLGYRDWTDYAESKLNVLNPESSFLSGNTLLTSDFNEGDKVECEWNPGRHVTFLYLGGNRFRVIENIKSKLGIGATGLISVFTLGIPLVITDLELDGKYIGNYMAGEKTGVTNIVYHPLDRAGKESEEK